MIGHETVSGNGEAISLTLGVQQVEMHLPISINKEHTLAVITPLGDMMRHTSDDCASDSWHGTSLSIHCAIIKQI